MYYWWNLTSWFLYNPVTTYKTCFLLSPWGEMKSKNIHFALGWNSSHVTPVFINLGKYFMCDSALNIHKFQLLLFYSELNEVCVSYAWILKWVKNFKNFMTPFCGWGSTASGLQPLWGGSLLFAIQFPQIPGTHFIVLGRLKVWVDLGATQWFWTWDPWVGNPAPWPLDHCSINLHCK